MKAWKSGLIATLVAIVLILGFTALNYWLAQLIGYNQGIRTIIALGLGMVSVWLAAWVYYWLRMRGRR